MASTLISTPDGQRFTVHSYGSGPGVVVVHGCVLWGRDYRRLALLLASRFTVHLYDRFGRGERPSQDGWGYSTEREIRDLAAVLDRTGARMLLGHSYGGYVAAQAARTLPIERLALYDPVISIGHNLPAGWLPPFLASVDAGRSAEAFAIASEGMGVAGLVSRLPMGTQEQMIRALLITPMGKRWRSTLPITIAELREVLAHSSTGVEYAEIGARTWIGAGEAGPDYYRTTSRLLADRVPRVSFDLIPGTGHAGILVPVPGLALRVADFLSG